MKVIFPNKRKLLSQLLQGRVEITSSKCKIPINLKSIDNDYAVTIAASCFICDSEGLLRNILDKEIDLLQSRWRIIPGNSVDNFLCRFCDKVLQNLVELEKESEKIVRKIEDLVGIIKSVRNIDKRSSGGETEDLVVPEPIVVSQIVIGKSDPDFYQDQSDLELTDDSEDENVKQECFFIEEDVKEEEKEEKLDSPAFTNSSNLQEPGSNDDQPVSVDIESCGAELPAVEEEPTNFSDGPNPRVANETSFKCSLCSKTFKQAHSVGRHMISAHDSPSPFVCSSCGRKFASKYYLSCHKQRGTQHCYAGSGRSPKSMRPRLPKLPQPETKELFVKPFKAMNLRSADRFECNCGLRYPTIFLLKRHTRLRRHKERKKVEMNIKHSTKGIPSRKSQKKKTINRKFHQSPNAFLLEENLNLKCPKCDKHFVNEIKLKNHLKYSKHLRTRIDSDLTKFSRDSNGMFTCQTCNYSCKRYSHLKIHCKSKVHSKRLGNQISDQGDNTNQITPANLNTSSQQICKRRTINREVNKSAKVKQNRNLKCPYCDLRFANWSKLHKHQKEANHRKVRVDWNPTMYPKDGNGTFTCEPCKYTCKHYSDMKIHLTNNCHLKRLGIQVPERSKTICEMCGELFRTQTALKQHFVYSHGGDDKREQQLKKVIAANKITKSAQDKAFKCPQCPKLFTTKYHFLCHDRQIHRKMKRVRKSHKCEICGKAARNQQGILRHKQKLHGIQVGESLISSTLRSRAICSVPSCKKEMPPATLTTHLEVQHFNGSEIEHGGILKCPYDCGWENENEENWVRHVEDCCKDKQETVTSCSRCNAGFPSHFLRLRHQVKEHSEFNMKCQFCSRSITTKYALERHLATHPEARPFPCSKCGLTFRTVWSLKVHYGSVCNDDEEAREAFKAKRKEKMRNFMEKEKPFKCLECGKGFVSTGRLESHKKKVHRNDGEDITK